MNDIKMKFKKNLLNVHLIWLCCLTECAERTGYSPRYIQWSCDRTAHSILWVIF